MTSLFAGVHIQDKTNEILALKDLDFEQNVYYLKEKIASKLDFNADNLDLIYKGAALGDDIKLQDAVPPGATVHCFKKTKHYVPYAPPEKVKQPEYHAQVQKLFTLTAALQINVASRVNILQKVVAEYPEFRRNLGAQALIRDSVLFNCLHQPEVVKNIAETYPIICDAAPFIVDTVKKELTRNSNLFSEPNTDSTTSSEEENSLGASSSNSERRVGNDSSSNQSESARIRQISRQQLQTALAQMGFGYNSLSNIAQRNTDANATGATASATVTGVSEGPTLSNSASGERITSEMFRNELARALNAFNPRRSFTSAAAAIPTAPTTGTTPMDTSDNSDTTTANSNPTTGGAAVTVAANDYADLPSSYRNHQYAKQLQTLVQMGFINFEENLIYLNLTNGNIENAINLLMGAMT